MLCNKIIQSKTVKYRRLILQFNRYLYNKHYLYDYTRKNQLTWPRKYAWIFFI